MTHKQTNISTRKIADLPGTNYCRHPEHNPPSLKLWEPGFYEHECPACGEKQQFTIDNRPTL